RPLPAPGARGLGRALASPAALAQSDRRRDRARDPRCPPPASVLGRQETPDPRAPAPPPLELARPVHRLRHPEAPWLDPAPASPPADRASRQADQPDSRAQ